MTVTELAMGQNVPLLLDGQEVDAIRVTVEWGLTTEVDLDVSALLLTGAGRVRDDADFVFHDQPEGGKGSVRLLGKSQDETTSSDRLLVSIVDLTSTATKRLRDTLRCVLRVATCLVNGPAIGMQPSLRERRRETTRRATHLRAC